MNSGSRESKAVIGELFDKMDRAVTGYGPGALKAKGTISGTGFFPGASGLWRGTKPNGQLPDNFPEESIMFLGHNFDSVQGHTDSICRGIERMNQGTWKFLLNYLDAANISANRCFFTNVFVGLQPKSANGKMHGSEVYYEQCRKLLNMQIDIVRPKVIAVLGADANDQFGRVHTDVKSVSLCHPGSLTYLKLADREAVSLKQGRILNSALDAI